MSRRKQALESLLKVKESLHKQSLIRLKDKIHQVELANQNLKILIDFRNEYHMPVENVNKGALLSRQSFVENLHLSIQEQRKGLKQATQQLKEVQLQVNESYRSCKGMSTLYDKEVLKEASAALKKQEQELEEIMQMRLLQKRAE